MKTDRIIAALTHALTCSLGPMLRPKMHKGQEDPKDAEALAVLLELRNGSSPATVDQISRPKDSPHSG
jgi:hypothetical protein